VPGPNQITYNLEANPGAATVLGTLTPLAKTWAGLTHLEAKTLDIVGDGIVFPQQVVVGGQVTMPRAVNEVEIGLHYETTIETLPPELMLPEGSDAGPAGLAQSEIVVRLYKSMGCKVENEQVPFRKFGAGVLDKAVAPFTGDKKVDVVGWDAGKHAHDQADPAAPVLPAVRHQAGDRWRLGAHGTMTSSRSSRSAGRCTPRATSGTSTSPRARCARRSSSACFTATSAVVDGRRRHRGLPHRARHRALVLARAGATDLAFFVRPDRRGSIGAVRLVQDFVAWARGAGAAEVCIAQSSGVRMDEAHRLMTGMKFDHRGGVFKWRLG
jgi:hypothetical protein